jgi:hypothetical protein
MLRFIRACIKFFRDCSETMTFDEYDIRSRKEADDKSKRWLHYLGSG